MERDLIEHGGGAAQRQVQGVNRSGLFGSEEMDSACSQTVSSGSSSPWDPPTDLVISWFQSLEPHPK